jgi:hypothetical protein
MARKASEGYLMPACEKETEVARALARGKLAEDLGQHTEVCPACHQVRSIAQQLQGLVEDVAEEPLRSAACTWWRLNLRMRREKVDHAKLPLVWMGRISFTTILFVTVFALSRVPILASFSFVMTSGLLALTAVALPISIVLWRWSRS